MKKIINNVENIVKQMCQGLVLAHPSLALDSHYKVVYRQALKKDKVSLISGGGSGHEPAHAGFVGEGLLDAAVCGDVFASPSQVQVYQAIRRVNNPAGTLLIIKNYSGDMMNFQGAQHLAQEDGLLVDYVQVDDDIAVQDSLYTVGRRGVAGTVFVHKVAGAAAEQGLSLLEVKRLAQKCAKQVKSLGFALNSCTVPAKGSPTFELGEQEIEYGVGIHGEPGIQRQAMQSSSVLADKMVSSIITELSATKGDEVAVLVNGFGATPLMELYIFYRDVAKKLESLGVIINKALVGNYMTSIDMAGASLSILKLDDELKTYIHSPCMSPALQIERQQLLRAFSSLSQEQESAEAASYTRSSQEAWASVHSSFSAHNMIYLVDAMAEVVIKNEVPFCELDAHAGDGDFGMSIAKGFRQLKHRWSYLLQFDKDIGRFLQEASLIMMEYCGGASGPIWGSAFRGAGRYAQGKAHLSVQEFAQMMQKMVEAIQATGERSFGRGADVGDKTLMDALIPAAKSWHASAQAGASWQEAFNAAAKEAVAGAQNTKAIAARMGRAGTVGERSIGYADAGAHALGVIFTELAQMLKFHS